MWPSKNQGSRKNENTIEMAIARILIEQPVPEKMRLEIVIGMEIRIINKSL